MRKAHYKMVLDVFVYSDDNVPVTQLLLYSSSVEVNLHNDVADALEDRADVLDVTVELVECKDSR